MLDPALVPTPLDPRGRRAVEVRPPAERPRFRRLHLLGRFAVFGLGLARRRLRARMTPVELAVALRDLFESLGGLWIKLGQFVAMRRDLLPSDFCGELGRLQDRATGFPGALARRIVEEDLGRGLESVFSEFEEHPFAAASIGQLHRARLRAGGHVVAVKVRRPHIEEAMEADLAFVRFAVRVLERLGVLREAHLGDFLVELTLALREELDYRLEATSIDRMRRSLKPHGLYVPRVFGGLCSTRVLTMELIDGVLMSELIAMREQDPERVSRWLSANKIKPGRVGRLLHKSLLRQIVEDNLFHGDLHPGNIVLLRKSRVALIDFGSIGSLEARFRTLYRLLNRALSDLDFEKVADFMSLIAPAPDPAIDWDRVRRNSTAALRRAELRAYAPNLAYHERSMTTALLDVARSLAGSGFPIGWAFMRVDRAHVTLDASLMYLIPEVSYLSLGQDYWAEAGRRGFGAALGTQILDGLRRARTVAGAGEVAEAIDRVGQSVRAGASSFQRSKRLAEELVELAAGLLAWTVLALALVVVLIAGARTLPALLATPLAGALPAATAGAPGLHWTVWLVLAGMLVVTSVRLLAVERSYARRPRDAAEDAKDLTA